MTDAREKRIRTCIGCGKRSDKVTLHRIVRTPEGAIRFDATGRAPGRGAYVCSRECLENANAKGKVARSLKHGIGKEEAAQVVLELEMALKALAHDKE